LLETEEANSTVEQSDVRESQEQDEFKGLLLKRDKRPITEVADTMQRRLSDCE
jgi:hypothetical protein